MESQGRKPVPVLHDRNRNRGNDLCADTAIRDDRKNMPVPVPALRHRLTNGSIHEPMIKDDRKIIFV